MNKLKKLFLLFLVSSATAAIAQEVSVPLNHLNLSEPKPIKVNANALHKAVLTLPVLDFFTSNGKTNANIWQPNFTEIVDEKLVLNVLDSSGNVYPSGQAADPILSQTINLTGVKPGVFLSFTVSSAATFTPGDSLLLYGRDVFGEWKVLWNSAGALVQNEEKLIDLDANTFHSYQFGLKFELWSNNLSASNNQTFTVSKLVLAEKWSLPFYDYLRIYNSLDSGVNTSFFAAPHVKVVTGTANGYVYGNCAKLDGYRFKGTLYPNQTGIYTGADTFYTHTLDLMQYAVSDTILYSFMLKSGIDNSPSDSIVVECRNNLGVWVRILALPGNGLNQFRAYTFNINNGRFRFPGFQSRFVFKTTHGATNKAYWLLSGFRLNRRIDLPFFDDFSNARVMVNADRWQDNFVYVNNEFPVNHPSINVATFDGLDANGNPYSKFPTKGICDYLTSRPISLKGLTPADSVILSFYYQYEPQGTTNQIYPDDFLEIELRNSAIDKDSFSTIKLIAAADTLLGKFNYFQYVVKDPRFFHEEFQIRFKNRGSQTGNLSQWHVDYIRFNKGRKLNDAIKDISLSNTPPIYLGPYTSMPWNQYQANKSAYGNIFDELRLVNHDNQPYAVDYFRTVFKPEGDTLDKFNNILPTLKSRYDSLVTINKLVNFNTNLVADSLVFQTRYRIKISGVQIDNVTGNDTFSVPTIFSNYYAYDDGSAEGGYGVKNETNSGANLRFKVETPDTLYGVYMFFNQSEQNVSTQRFTIKVWKRLSPLFEPATSDEVLYSQEVSKPLYTNSINGFASFKFSKPIAVSDSFYVGWEQTNAYVLNVGLDKNYRFGLNPNMQYKMGGRWYPAAILGALMIRPIVGKFIGTATGKTETTFSERPLKEVSFYPNPAASEVWVDFPGIEKANLYSLTGQFMGAVKGHDGHFTLPELTDGFYLIQFENSTGGLSFAKKLLIQH